MLIEKYPEIAERMTAKRPLLYSALQDNQEELQRLLKEEEDNEREADQQYWKPLRDELEAWRLGKTEQ